MEGTSFKACVTNGMLRKALVVTRSLGRQGIDVFVSDTHSITAPAWSKYCRGHSQYPDPRINTTAFYTWLKQEARRLGPAVLYPMDDDVMDALMTNPDSIPSSMRVLLPQPTTYWKMRNKGSAVEAARAFGFLCPDTYVGTDQDELRRWMRLRAFPLVLKAPADSGSRGFHVWPDEQGFMKDWTLRTQSGKGALAQQFIPPGERLDVCLLCNGEAQVVAGFVQRELRYFPLSHGPSTAQESISDPKLLEQCVEFATQMGWKGVIEFEFLRDAETGQLYFMEANTRFWNSLACSVYAGVDFVHLYYQLCTGQPVRPIFEYREGIRCRSLLPADILHFIVRPRLIESGIPFFSGPAKGGIDDIVSLDDPLPIVAQMLALLILSGRSQTWRDLLCR